MDGALVLVEPGDELSLQALAFARAWGEPVALVIGADAGPLGVRRGARRVARGF